MSDQSRPSFAEMRRKLAEQRGRKLETEEARERVLKSVPSVDDDLVPDVLPERSEEDLEIDNIIANIDPIAAYRKWIGKEVNEKETSQEECHVSCPFPNHRDKNPSTWILTRPARGKPKGTWFCGGCQQGGDLLDMAAIHFGMPDYKNGKNFHELRQKMAESFGYRFKKVAGQEIIWREESEEGPGDSSPADGVQSGEPSGSAVSEPAQSRDGSDSASSGSGEEAEDSAQSNVVTLHEKDVEDEPEEQINYPSINWREIVPQDTFLWKYLEATSQDDSPEEYHFWHGLLALAHAVGRNVYLDDMKYVYGNMLICLLGGTGYGKSRSREWLDTVLEEAVPFRDNGLDTSGCKLVSVAASGENLINQFQHIAQDPSMPKGSAVRTPVNGIVDYDEFAGLIERAMRKGNTLKVYIQQFADSRNRISSSSNTGGTFEAYKPFCSITASTQPKAVRSLLSKYDTGSGFLNRWVFVGGQRKKRESIGGKRSGIVVDLEPAIEELKKVRGWGAMERSVELDDEGFEEWDKWFHDTIEPMQLKDETDLLPRIGLTMKRLLLLFAINEKSTVVSAEDVRRIKPIFDYLVKCYTILNAEIGLSFMQEITQEIMRHVKRIEEQTGRGASARDLGLRMKRKNYSPEMINKALKTLVDLDWLDQEKGKGPGRPTIRYKVVAS